MVVEPLVQGAAGMILQPPGWLKEIEKLCHKQGTFLIADEVAVGFGRTGTLFACEQEKVRPDFLCLAKGLSAGYLPLAATLATEKVYQGFLGPYDSLKTFFHGHSYTANPLGCAVGLASLDLFRSEGTLQRVGALEQRLRSGLEPLADLPHVGDVRVIGGVGIIELTADGERKSDGGYLASIGPKLYEEFLARGLLLRPLGNVLYFMPPYVITDSEIDWALEQIEEVIRSVPWPTADSSP